MDLSIVIPVYRSEEILPQLIDGIFSSVPSELIFEVVLVNDRRPDDSWPVIQRLAEDRPNVFG